MKFKITILTFLLALFLLTYVEASNVYIYLLSLLFLLVIVIASARLKLNFFTHSICHIQTTNREIALTFDDGPHPIYTPLLLDLLAKHQAKASFFCIGAQVAAHPEIAQRIVAEGHTIANHSYEHANSFPCWRVKKIRNSIQMTDQAIQDATQLVPNYFRPPFGAINNLLAKAIKKENKQCVGWSIRTKDTCRTAQEVMNLFRRKIRSGAIILLHDTQESCLEIVEQMLLYCAENGYKPVALTFKNQKI